MNKAEIEKLLEDIGKNLSAEYKGRYEEDKPELRKALTKPLVLPRPGNQQGIIPDWMHERIRAERVDQVLYKRQGEATDPEIVAYLHAASHKAALNDTYTNILLFLKKQEFSKAGSELSDKIQAPESLSDYEKSELTGLRTYLWELTERAYNQRNQK